MTVCVAVAVGEALAEPDARAEAVPVPEPLPEAPADPRVLGDGGAVTVPLKKPEDVTVAVGPAFTDGVKIRGSDEAPPPVQAVIETEKTTVAVAQPAAVSLALLTFMRPPFIPGGQWA